MLQENQKYEYLERMITKRGIRKTIIARVVGISPKTLTNKVNGKAAFTWPEVQVSRSLCKGDAQGSGQRVGPAGRGRCGRPGVSY